MYEREFRPSLIQDMEEENGVKLDMRTAPWEITGEVTSVGENTFTLSSYPDRTFRISDIIYYRLG